MVRISSFKIIFCIVYCNIIICIFNIWSRLFITFLSSKTLSKSCICWSTEWLTAPPIVKLVFSVGLKSNFPERLNPLELVFILAWTFSKSSALKKVALLNKPIDENCWLGTATNKLFFKSSNLSSLIFQTPTAEGLLSSIFLNSPWKTVHQSAER